VQLGLPAAVLLGAAAAIMLGPGPAPEPELAGQVGAGGEPGTNYTPPIEPKPSTVESVHKQSEEQKIPLAVKGEHAGKDQLSGEPGDQASASKFYRNGQSYAELGDEPSLAMSGHQANKQFSDEQRVFPKHEAALNSQSWESAWKRKDYGQAFEIAAKLDGAGDPAGAYGLGLAYHTGKALPRSTSKGLSNSSIRGHRGGRHG
jgi:hypothetical protein